MSAIEEWKSLNIEILLEDGRQGGVILGPRGENIRRLQEETGATITVESKTIYSDNISRPTDIMTKVN